jgi:hypothetical protein
MHGPEHRNGNGAHADAGECIRDAPAAFAQPQAHCDAVSLNRALSRLGALW